MRKTIIVASQFRNSRKWTNSRISGEPERSRDWPFVQLILISSGKSWLDFAIDSPSSAPPPPSSNPPPPPPAPNYFHLCQLRINAIVLVACQLMSIIWILSTPPTHALAELSRLGFFTCQDFANYVQANTPVLSGDYKWSPTFTRWEPCLKEILCGLRTRLWDCFVITCY